MKNKERMGIIIRRMMQSNVFSRFSFAFLILFSFFCSTKVSAQYNVDRLIMSGRVAVYYEDYILGIQYFNQVIAMKPYLYEPWQMRAIAKFHLDGKMFIDRISPLRKQLIKSKLRALLQGRFRCSYKVRIPRGK